jgi:hypothetical protein
MESFVNDFILVEWAGKMPTPQDRNKGSRGALLCVLTD